MAPRASARALLACLGLVVAGAGCAGCTARKDPPADAAGGQIYEFQNCQNCHGRNGEGTALGPPLAKLSSHWTRAALTQYLADPEAAARTDERLGALANAYSGRMTRYDNLSEEQRSVLAGWLLERHP